MAATGKRRKGRTGMEAEGTPEGGRGWALTGTLRAAKLGCDENGKGNIFLLFFLENLGNK
jgi:hypothetical protein